MQLNPGEKMQITVPFKASLQGVINVKFLFRYEVFDARPDAPNP